MKRWTLALAVLLGGTLSFAHGDYVILIYNVGAAKSAPTEPKSVAGGAQGRPGAGALGGKAGPMPPGAGAVGGAGRGAPPGAGGTGVYGGGFSPPPGGGAFGGGLFPGGAGGFRMGSGGPRMGGAGGQFPGAPGGLAGTGAGGAGGEAEGAPLYVRAVVEVEVTRKDGKLINGGKHGWVTHKWGQTCLMETDSTFLAAVVHHPSVTKVYEAKKKNLTQGGEKPTLPAVLDLAEWTLSHGRIAEYLATMKLAEEIDPKNAAVLNFKQIDANINKPLSGGDLAGEWKAKVAPDYTTTSSDHYLLYQTKKATPAEVKSRLAHLENQFKVFYYWFASQGQMLPMPAQRLVALLVPEREEFERQQGIFESTHLVDDGFYARRESLVVLSQLRIDTPYLALVDHNKPLWTEGTFDRDQMLRGKVPSRTKLSKFDSPEDKLTEAHTMALLERALEEDAELAAVSHDGTRQLLAAAGLTTPGVIVPEWIQFGMASFFETPKGAPWTTVGSAHWDYLPFFQDLVEKDKARPEGEKKLEKPGEVLKGIVTDRYFRLAANSKKSKPDDDAEMKARSLAWALTYYLARNKLDGLLRYYQEIKKLPRDIEFDDEALLNCFGRAFELMDSTGKKIDEAKLAAFADTLHRVVVRWTPGEAADLMTELKKNREDAMQAKPADRVNPFNPPGGFGAGGGAP